MIVGSPTKLNLIPSGVMPVVYINQGDAGYDKEFLIYNGDSPYNVPSGVSATIRGTKADGYGVTEAATVTTGSNLVTVTITEQMVAAAGKNLYELVFVDTDGLRVASINMVWAVKKDALGDAVISDSDLDYVSQAMDRIQGAEALKNQLDINTADIAAETAARIAADDTERTARIAADSALQANINSEASTRANRDSTLQAQINQLVAPTGSAPSAAEILDARVGADSVTYDTLGNAIRTQVINLDGALDGNAVFEGTFERTSLYRGNKTAANYRVSETAIISPSYDLQITISSGFRIGVHYFENDTFTVDSGWITQKYYIPQNKHFKFVIARTTDDTSEVADIQTFRSAVTFKNIVGQNNINCTGLKEELICSNNGVQTFREYGKFQSFGLDGHAFYFVQRYRVSNMDPMTFDEDLVVSVKSGFRWGYVPYSDGAFGTWSGWFTTPKFMPKGTSFIVQIARTTEVTSEIADVDEFLNAVTFPNKAGNNSADISALDGRTQYLETVLTDPSEMPFEQGVIYSGLDYASDTYVRTQGYIYMPVGSEITLGKFSGQLIYSFYYYNQPNSNGFIQSDPNGVTVNANSEAIYTTIIEGYVRCRVQRGSGSAITPDVMAGVVTYKTNQLEITKRDISIGTLFGKYSYDSEESYDTKVAAFASLINDNSADSYLFFTDPHVFGANGTYAKNIVDKYMSAVQHCYYQSPCSFIVCGGDWLNNGDTAEQAKYKLGIINGITRHMFPGEYYPIVGNHDTNYLGTGDNRELQPQTIANLWNSNRGANYYSFKTSNARYYVLDTGEENQTTMTAYRWQQLQWLAENLITNDDSHNTVMFHIYYMAGIETSISEMANKIGLLIAAYNSRSNIDLNGRTFSFSQCSGHIDYSLVGHSHSDFDSVLGGVPVIGTINMQSGNVPSFDMIHVDYDTMTFNAVRVGTGVSRTISL